MNTLFVIQLIASFLVGGGIITLQSFIAEKVSKKVSGIVLTVPTTVAIGFFFLGWTLSSEIVADIAPSTLIPLGLSMLFAAGYPYIAECFSKIIKHTFWQIFASYVVSIALWFALAVPVVIFEVKSLAIGVAGYVLCIVMAHFALKRKHYAKPVTLVYSNSQKIGRAVFVGCILFLVVLLGKTLGPFWGGMFAMFPAAFSSFMMIFHWYYGPQSLFPTMQHIPIGSLSLFAYVLTVMLVFPPFGFIIGTIGAYIVSLIVTVLLMKFQAKDTQHAYLPTMPQGLSHH